MTNINSIKEQDDNSSPRGRSLENDFKRLINDERFYDIALKCSDGMIHGCKAILATRSDVFNSSIFNKSTKCNNTLSFDDINKTAMRVILEFLYTSKVENMLDADNVIEVYYASIHFDLIDLQDHILEFIQSLINVDVDIGKKLLSECVRKFSLEVDNKVSHILVQCVAKNKLEKRDKDSLSLEGLRYLLKKTFDTRIPFATSEFNIWEYSLMKAIRKVVQNDTLVEKILDKSSFSTWEPQVIEEIKNHMTTLIDYINLNRMDVEEIKQVEPFNIHTIEKLKDVYRSIAENEGSGFIRGIPVFRWRNDNIDNTVNVYNNGFTVETVMPSAPVLRNFRDGEVGPFVQPKSILGDLILKGRGVYEWNILIEKMYKHIYIGICDIHENLNNNFSFTNFSFNYRHGWVLGSDGYVYHRTQNKWYDARFNEGDKVTVHLDMKNRTCAFSINNNSNPIVFEWKNIPSQVYPIVSLGHGSKVTITY